MRKRMLRSVLVAAFSTVVAFGTLAGLSGVESSVHKVGGAHIVTAADVDDDTPVVPLDTSWD
jgi:hypothetical protein